MSQRTLASDVNTEEHWTEDRHMHSLTWLSTHLLRGGRQSRKKREKETEKREKKKKIGREGGERYVVSE